MSIGNSFDQTAAYYDSWMKKALPGYEDLFGTALQAIPFEPDTPIQVLDLGAGTGLFSQLVLARCPRAHFVLIDLAEKLLGIARRRFAEYPNQFEYRLSDYRTIDGREEVDLVISSLSIHHLSDEEKQHLFGSIHRLLKPGGVFINIDQIRGETPTLQQFYWEKWLAHVRRMGGTQEEIDSSVERRRTFDRDALLGEQLAWLRAAGFVDVDCLYKYYFVGVFTGTKTRV